MDNKKLDAISGTLAEMRIIAEGSISLFEKAPKPEADDYSLIGEALYMIRDRISYCLLACQESEKSV